jgi:hypothetical protein
MWDHFVAELVAALLTWGLLLGGAAVGLVLAYLKGVGDGRRDAYRAVADMRVGFEQQIELTVPMLSACAREGDR